MFILKWSKDKSIVYKYEEKAVKNNVYFLYSNIQ